MEVSFKGRVAVVTGAGRGLGRTHALELARRDAAVVVNDLPEADGSHPAEAVVEEITAAGGRAVPVNESVGTVDGGRAVVDAALESFGSVDVVINNAGPLRWARFDEMPQDYLDNVLQAHLMGAFYVTQPAWAVMRSKGYGRVVMTSSNTALFGMDTSSNYAAAKGGLAGLTRALAIEGVPLGIKVNAILPAAATSERVGSAQRIGADTERIGAAFAPLADRMTPEFNSVLVAVLASEACPTSGETFSSVAGRYARVFTGLAPGWVSASEKPPAPEELLEHFDEVRDVDGYAIPGSAAEELEIVGRQRGVAA